MNIRTQAHPNLDIATFISVFPSALSKCQSPPNLLMWFSEGCNAPLSTSEGVKSAIRELLRQDGFKPTGRSKPASEYLLKAIEKGWFGPDRGINLAVDACNVVSLHSGLPISVIDLDLTEGSLMVARCKPETRYVFNPSGQVIDVSGLISLHDEQGPCAGPVKDSQRTKTNDETRRTLSIIWGTSTLAGRTSAALRWYRELLTSCGVTTQMIELTPNEPSMV